MNIEHLLNKGYFPKELPPSFFAELFGNDYSNISTLADSTKNASLTALQNSVNAMTGLSRPEKSFAKNQSKIGF
jgi:hypothetical protein